MRGYTPRRTTADLVRDIRARPGITRVHTIAPRRGTHPRPTMLRVYHGPVSTDFTLPQARAWLAADVSSDMHPAATLMGGSVPAHVPGAYPSLSCCGGSVALVPADPYDRAIAYAADRGRQDGTNAAGWYVQDTLTQAYGGRTVIVAAAILSGIDDHDPAIMDGFPWPDLSGQWADTLTGPALVAEAFSCGYGPGEESHAGDESVFWHADAFGDICDAYETAYSDAVESAIATACRSVLED